MVNFMISIFSTSVCGKCDQCAFNGKLAYQAEHVIQALLLKTFCKIGKSSEKLLLLQQFSKLKINHHVWTLEYDSSLSVILNGYKTF